MVPLSGYDTNTMMNPIDVNCKPLPLTEESNTWATITKDNLTSFVQSTEQCGQIPKPYFGLGNMTHMLH